MNCKKCNNLGSLTIRSEHIYCDNCFMLNINHKFRACIGKSKILSSNEKVLVCLTGGLSSTVLLDLIYNGLSQDNHKKLRIIPFFVHLSGLGEKDNDLKVAKLVIEQCQRYNFDVYIVNTSMYSFQKPCILSSVNSIAEIDNCVDNDSNSEIKTILCEMTPTSRNDIEIKIKRNIFTSIANQLQCNFIFTAETATTLAINLLSNFAIGRGSQVEDDIGFLDNRDENIKLLRPMKDITKEELNHYARIKKLIHIPFKILKGNSLQSVITNFVSDLQENFPSTISTVCKTANKIVANNNNIERCQFCKSYLGMKCDKITAEQATTFSKSVSSNQPCKNFFNKANTYSDTDPKKSAMFPIVDNCLCYCCSRNYLEGSLLERNILNINIT